MTENKQSKEALNKKIEAELKLLFKESEYKDMSNFQVEQNSLKIAQEKYKGDIDKNIKKGKIDQIDVVSFLNNKLLNEFLEKLMKIINNEYTSNRSKKRPFYEIIKLLKDHSHINRKFIKKHNAKCQFKEQKIELHEDLINVDFSRLAEITIANVIQCGFERATINNTSRKIGNSLNDEIIFDYFRDNYKELFIKKKDDYKYNSNTQLRTSMVFMANKLDGFDLEQLNQSSKTLVGKVLLEIFLDNFSNVAAVNSFVQSNKHRKKKNHKTITEIYLTDEFKKELDRLIGIRIINSTEFKPMTIKPKDWTSVWDGGYYSIANLTLIKANKKDLNKMKKFDLSYCMEQINRIQAVPYKINHDVFDVMKNLFLNSIDDVVNRYGDDVLPVEIKKETQPQRPPILDAEVEIMNEDEKKIYFEELNDWKSKMHTWYYDRASSESKRNLMRNILSIASEYRNKDLYFPHQFDKRGRIYAVPKFLNPQSNDYSKGLLLLKNKQKITENGRKAIKFHIANVFAFDKIDKESFENKVAWTEKNHDLFMNIANDPYENTQWHDADKPWQALAACFEYRKMIEQGDDFETSLIVDVDGSNNGLQVFAALLKDLKTAEMCNIADNDEPKDSYQVVADIVRSILIDKFETDFTKEQQNYIQKILAMGFGRKEAKTPVMTLSYGSTKNGWVDQILKVYKKKIASGDKNVFNDIYEMHNAVRLIADLLEKVMPEVIEAPFTAMYSIKKYMKFAAEHGKDEFIWQNPCGFPLFQRYKKTESKQVKMMFDRKNVVIQRYFENEKNNILKLLNASSPNFIHSLDSCNLLMTVEEMTEKYNVHDYVFVHDSFGCNANDLHLMRQAVRDTFTELHYENHFRSYIKNIIEDIEHSFTEEEILNDTERGDFDLEEVRRSKYSFN